MVGPSLEDMFPGLRGQPYEITSPRELRYNCIAFIAGDTSRWCWPDPTGQQLPRRRELWEGNSQGWIAARKGLATTSRGQDDRMERELQCGRRQGAGASG
jgi:hypothetical protein